MEKNVRYAVIGCGDHAVRGHIIPANGLEELELVGAFDPEDAKMIEARDARAAHSSFTRYKSEEALLGDPEIDAVVICSPDRYHVTSLAKAVTAGKHVLCDKPLAAAFEDLRVLRKTLDEAEERGVVVSSCHPRRFDPPYVWLKRNLRDDQGTFGDVQSLELDFSYHKPSKTGLHAGLLADHFNHEFDLLHFLFGHAPAAVHRLYDDDARYLAVGMRDDGIGFSFHGTRKLEEKEYREFVKIRFAAGQVDLDCGTGVAIVHDHESGGRQTIHPGKTDYLTRFRAVMSDFAGAILDGTPGYLSKRDLLANAESCVWLTRSPHYNYRPLI